MKTRNALIHPLHSLLKTQKLSVMAFNAAGSREQSEQSLCLAKELRLIYSERRTISNYPRVKEMLMVKAVMAIACFLGKGFQLTGKEERLISSFQPFTGMLSVNGVMEIACCLRKEFPLIFVQRRVISKFRRIKRMVLANVILAIA
jgi:hypothetical protein